MTSEQPQTAGVIQYLQPLGYGWQRMKMLLFQPFLVERWFVLGFVAWLAGFNPSTSSGFNIQSGDFGGFEPRGDSESRSSLVVQSSVDWLTATFGTAASRLAQDAPWDDLRIPGLDAPMTGVVIGCIVVAVVGLCGIGLLFLWLNSRFQFIFIDDLVHNRHLIQDPWRRFKTQGNSLFFFQLLFGLAIVVLLILLILLVVLMVGGAAGLSELGDSWAPAAGTVITISIVALAFFPLFLGLVFFNYCLRAFVVPIMVKDSSLNTTAAIGKFWRLFKSRPAPFLLYALLILGIEFLLGLGLFIVGLMTCCIGLLLLMLPYIGAVIILPLTSWMRYSSLAFLRQFGEEFDLLLPPTPPAIDGTSSAPTVA